MLAKLRKLISKLTVNPKIVISLPNIVEGGPLVISRQIIFDILSYLNKDSSYSVIVICHSRHLFSDLTNSNVLILPVGTFGTNQLLHLVLQFFILPIFSVLCYPIHTWISLNDVTPLVLSKSRITYIHCPLPFSHLYKPIALVERIRKNFLSFCHNFFSVHSSLIIVQQNWIKEVLVKNFSVLPEKIVVSSPKLLQPYTKLTKTDSIKQDRLNSSSFIYSQSASSLEKVLLQKTHEGELIFIYPAISRPHKNFSFLLDLSKYLNEKGLKHKFLLTLTNQEFLNCVNQSTKCLPEKDSVICPQTSNFYFLGRLLHEDLLNLYNFTSALVFPSMMETWGLPLTEYTVTNKPIFVSDLPWARETLQSYPWVTYFDPTDYRKLALVLIENVHLLSSNTKWNYDQSLIYNPSDKSHNHASYELSVGAIVKQFIP